MPIYAYECQHCGYRFEMKQGFESPPVSRCPNCEGKPRRIISIGAAYMKSKVHPEHRDLTQAEGGYWVKEGTHGAPAGF